MTVFAIVAICVVLFGLALLLPRLSRHPQRATNKSLGTGAQAAGKAPGRLGRWLAKPFHTSSRAANRSASHGRRTRNQLPF